MGTISHVNQDQFDQEVLKSDTTVIVDFWAEWCAPCRALGPLLEEISGELGDKVKIVKLNVDQNGDIAQKYGIRGIPTMMFFKNGEAAKTLVGLQPKAEIVKSIEELA